MEKFILHKRIACIAAFLILLTIEVLIALFVRDRFIRPYGGDILVTVLLCCFCRIFLPEKPRCLSAFVFLFAAAVEIGQYFQFVHLLGLEKSVFWRTLLGSTFSFADILCYMTGCVLFAAAEILISRRKHGGESHDKA